MKRSLSELPTYVYIDGSNIRYACKDGLGLDLNYKKLYKYLAAKYPNLKRIAYFEGREKDDSEKLNIFKKYKNYGYEVLSLDRKKYVAPAVYKKSKCKKCKTINNVRVLPKTAKFKSNVDVYLCSEMMFDAMKIKGAAHLLLMSCDGDYAEMIKKLLTNFPNLHITVLATPFTKPVNFLSVRLKEMLQYKNYRLVDISTIKDRVS